jgi:2-(1,2-epoxy-1,2-dihydrophenyl)acetyl-CoA isomerase
MTEQTVVYEVAHAVATITLNRPKSMNSLTAETKAALLAALERAAGDDGVRAVLLTATGRAFSAGQDLREHAENLSGGRGLDDTVRRHYNKIITVVTEMPKPVLAAVNGVAAGAGAALAFAADLRVAADTASFLMAFTRVGLGPDSGASWTLQRLVGAGKAVELLMLAEPIDAAEALRIGLVSRVVPAAELPEAARELAERLAKGPTRAYAAVKVAVRHAATADLADALEKEAELQEACAATEDHRQATVAFVAKQPPTFEGR